MRRRTLLCGGVAMLTVITVMGAPVGAAAGPDCSVITAAADRLEVDFNRVHPYGYTGVGVGMRIRADARPLARAGDPAATRLYHRANTLAGRVDDDEPDSFRISSALAGARRAATEARQACRP